MRPKSGLPKRKALRNMPKFAHGFRENPVTEAYRNPLIGPSAVEFTQPPVTAVSFFAGCGGLDFGLLGGFQYLDELYTALPFDIKAAYDIDAKAIETYKLNISDHAEVRDLVNSKPQDLPHAEILLGGFPCQDFSSCGPKQGLDGTRGRLYRVLIDYMKVHRPLIAVGENVPHLKKMHGGTVLDTIVRELGDIGYRVKVWDLLCPDYGLPQSRRRLFIVCVRDDLPGHPKAPVPSHFMNHRPIEAGIDDLKPITDESVVNQSQYFVATAATAGGGQGDHVSKKGEIAFTVRANAKARIHFHYELPRRLTVRECARLQSFPDEFVFPHAAMNAMLQIGNAVPPIVAHHVGRSLLDYVNDVRTSYSIAS
jgi:DNA (cytosine-5)-methyltransferase 1